MSVSLFLMHGHSFEQIWTKFGMWHTNTLHVVVVQLMSADNACRLAFRVPLVRHCKSMASCTTD